MRYNKYRNKPQVINGNRFASKKEARRYNELLLLEKAGEINMLRMQVGFPLWINGSMVGRYIADFVYRDKDGKDVVEDTKGFKTPVYKLKKNLLWALHRIEIKET